MPHRGFIFIPEELRDLSISTDPETNCCIRTLSCVGSSMPISSRPRVFIIVGCSIGTVHLTSIACIISSRGPVRSLTALNAAVSACAASSARRSSSTDSILFCYTGRGLQTFQPQIPISRFSGPNEWAAPPLRKHSLTHKKYRNQHTVCIIGVLVPCAVVFYNRFVLRSFSHRGAKTPIWAKTLIPVGKSKKTIWSRILTHALVR